MSIYNDTPIVPEIIADDVAREACDVACRDDLPGLSDWLANRAERVYAASYSFRQKIRGRGNSGRDTLRMFMRHWAASWLVEHQVMRRSAVPRGFCLGGAIIDRA
jgi:hypothetical protein